MKLSAQEEYGLRCLVAIARRQHRGSATIPEIARIEGLGQPHVAKLLSLLRQRGYIRSTRGQAGGYQLARPADQILVSDVLLDLGGRLFDDAFCERHSGQGEECNHTGWCGLRGLWTRVQKAVDEAIAGMTIQDLLLAEPPVDGFVPIASVESRAQEVAQ